MTTRKIPDLLVEQLALGELDAAEAERVRAALAREQAETGVDRLAALEASNREILADYPPSGLAAKVRRRAEAAEPAPASKGRALWLLGPALAAAAVLVWVVTRDGDDPGGTKVAEQTVPLVDDGQPEPTRIKGGVEPHLVVDRQTEAGRERLGPGEAVGEGDRLQLGYVAAGRDAGVILSIDGAGVVTLHHPASADAPATLVAGDEVPLDHSYELDDAPGFERFVLVTRDEGPLVVAEVVAAAERLAADPDAAQTAPLALAGEGWHQHAVLLRKPSPAGSPAPEPALGQPDGGGGGQ